MLEKGHYKVLEKIECSDGALYVCEGYWNVKAFLSPKRILRPAIDGCVEGLLVESKGDNNYVLRVAPGVPVTKDNSLLVALCDGKKAMRVNGRKYPNGKYVPPHWERADAKPLGM
jgi:hypothetical protein